MIVSRETMQVKYGKMDEVLAVLALMQENIHYPFTRVLTDRTGRHSTLVLEIEAPDLAEWENFMQAMFSEPTFNRDFKRLVPFIEHGERTLFTLVDVPYVPFKADPKRAVVIRYWFKAKFGRGDELVELFKEAFHASALRRIENAPRVLVDASGPFFTVITEYEAHSVAEWESFQKEIYQVQKFQGWFAKMMPLIEDGGKEFYSMVNFEGMAKPKAAKRGPSRYSRR